MYGFGEYVEHDYGHSFITEPSDYFIDNKYLKSIWDYSETMLSVQYNFKLSNLQDINLSDSYLASIAYTFPFSKSNYFTLGFNPYTLSNGDFNINKSNRIIKNKSNPRYIFTGIQILKSKIFLKIKKKKFPLSLIYDQLIEKRRIFGIVYNGSWFHIGTLESLKEYKMMLK